MTTQDYIKVFTDGYQNYAAYLWYEVTNPSWHNYFYWLIGLSLASFLLEILAPWRSQQATFRKDFCLDLFYMFFNFFLFSLLIYNAASDVVVHFLNENIKNWTNFDLQASNPMRHLPHFAILGIGFVVRDFIQWQTHRLMHRSAWLWEFHKVHHSVAEMGFAAHLRYHWMENVVYRSIEYLPLALLGIGLHDFFVIHIFTLAVGHLNHSNIRLPLGALKYIFNSPQMHIWHHAHDLPAEYSHGANFGLTLSVWDYLFGTSYEPYDGRDIQLGFPQIEQYPNTFWQQFKQPFVKK